MSKRSSHYLFLPVFSPAAAQGQRRLEELQRLSEVMTVAADSLRAEGYQKITFEMVLKRTKEQQPEAYERIVPSAYTFTGRRVIPNEKAFFEWYVTTAEGVEYRSCADRYAPGIFGRFAHIEK